uniref:Oxysterol-binding protein n=1 Tax=Cyprinodon variegatus TaxID=28743 RepID=A0A3Q2FU07_CYPVA
MDSNGSSLIRSQSLASGLEKTLPSWNKPALSQSSSTLSSRHSRQIIKDWEVIDDLQVEMQAGSESPQDKSAPGICEGYLLKRRKWPLKGWHKRYFILEAGILRYSKSQQDVSKGRVQGSLDVSHAVMSINKKSNRIDLDAGDILYHIKAKSHDLFYIWVTKLQAHRLFKKNEPTHAHSGFLQALCNTTPTRQSFAGADNCAGGSGVLPSANTAVNTKVSAWLKQSHNPDTCVQELNQCNMDLSELSRLIQRLQEMEVSQTFTNGDLQRIISIQNLSLEKPKKTKSGKMWGHSRTLSRVEALGMLSSSHLSSSSHLGVSVPSIPDYVYSQLSPPTIVSPEGKKIQQDICAMSARVLSSLKLVHETLSLERQKLLEAWEANNLHQSNTLAVCFFFISIFHQPAPTNRPPSVTDSVAEYFDASDDVLGGSSSEVSYESGLSDGSTSNSEPEEGHDLHIDLLKENKSRNHILYELLDTASNTPDPYQRMVYIAAFAISGYSTATFRNRYKPFNPVLGETFECIREDRGFRFISEQVCHHPPISACHAESENFTFWQDQRWKNKFWGKSLEIVPTGMVNVTLPRYGDHYEWNKVVTCIHNVLSQQRYLEHYGEVTIQNLTNNTCTCKITFVKSRYWGSDSNKNEVQGTVTDQSGNVIHRFGGLWHEGIFCDTLPTPKCIWKPHPQPKDYLLYYGFSSFAMELNELTPNLKPLLPSTDTRLRPDQRLLEEGKVAEADKKKDDVEEIQRERRKQLMKRGEEHVPRFFRAKDSSGRDVWLSNGTYWELRDDPGFSNLENITLW